MAVKSQIGAWLTLFPSLSLNTSPVSLEENLWPLSRRLRHDSGFEVYPRSQQKQFLSHSEPRFAHKNKVKAVTSTWQALWGWKEVFCVKGLSTVSGLQWEFNKGDWESSDPTLGHIQTALRTAKLLYKSRYYYSGLLVNPYVPVLSCCSSHNYSLAKWEAKEMTEHRTRFTLTVCAGAQDHHADDRTHFTLGMATGCLRGKRPKFCLGFLKPQAWQRTGGWGNGDWPASS